MVTSTMSARRVAGEQVAQRARASAAASSAPSAEEQLLALVDRQDKRRRPCARSRPTSAAKPRLLDQRCEQRPQRLRAAADDRALSSARVRASRAPSARLRAHATSPVSPEIAARSGRTIGSGRKLRSSRCEPRQQAGAQERRLAGARCAEDDEQPRRRRLAQAAQRGRAPRRSARRGRRRCRRPRLRAAAGRDRAAGPDRSPAARRRSAHRGRRAAARS